MSPDFIPCNRFDEWTYQAAAVLGAAAAEIHAAVTSGDTTGANQKLAGMVPAVDAIAAEFRQLLGKPTRSDMAEESDSGFYGFRHAASGTSYGPFTDETRAAEFAEANGLDTSDFEIFEVHNPL